MLQRLLALLACLVALPASAGNECQIELALAETIGAPGSTAQVVSVIPYDASDTGSGLRVCWAPEAGKDALGIEFQAAPAGVTCEAADTSWAANERVDLTMDVLTAGTRYWYKVQCDGPDSKNPSNLWTNRPIHSFQTLPAAGVDADYTFSWQADDHFYANWAQQTGILGGQCGVRDQIAFGEDPSWTNLTHAIGQMAAARGLFHANMGDFYMTDSGGTNTCPKSLMLNPPDGTIGEGYTELWDQNPGWPTRDAAGTASNGIQTAAVDSGVRADAEFHIWRTHKTYEALHASAPFVFAWGNHDNPRFPAWNDAGDCNRWTDDGQGSPKQANQHMSEAWLAMLRNPNDLYPNAEADCDGDVDPDPTVTCDNDGFYYTFSAGLAQYWIVNPFQESGGGGTDASAPFDLSGRYPETPSHWSLGQAQYQWLRETMEASNAKWKFVLTHHPAGGILADKFENSVVSTGCYHYGRGSILATTERRCDDNGDTVGEGKLCEGDDSIPRGFDAAQDDRPAPWVATYGWCNDGKLCLPTPYNNRTATLAGHPTYGAPAIHALLAANLDDGGTNFVLQGHDHTTVGGCKVETDGCSEVWHITSGQTQGSDGDGQAPPPWGQDGLFAIYHDFNGDSIPDYRTDGEPYPTPVDVAAGTIRKAGSQIRGFFLTEISSEGVEFRYVASDTSDFPSLLATEIVGFRIGEAALYETDFNGALAADGESKNDTPPTVAQASADSTAVLLEGAEVFETIGTGAAVVTHLEHQSGFAAVDEAWADFLLRPKTFNAGGNGLTPFQFEAGAVLTYGSMLVTPSGAGTGLPSARSRGGTVSTNCPSDLAVGQTYMVRVGFNRNTDLTTLLIDTCDANDLECDGKHDGTGAPVTVPVWGTGATCNVTADGSEDGTLNPIDGFRVRGNQNAAAYIDAIGICDRNLGKFKCGDGFE